MIGLRLNGKQHSTFGYRRLAFGLITVLQLAKSIITRRRLSIPREPLFNFTHDPILGFLHD
jgi:hypothetical protein